MNHKCDKADGFLSFPIPSAYKTQIIRHTMHIVQGRSEISGFAMRLGRYFPNGP